MTRFSTNIRPFAFAELRSAERAELTGDATLAFWHHERAHVLGQHSTLEHVRVHVLMLGWAWRHRNRREFAGQLLRIVGAATKTALGLVPTGNTGGSDVSPLRRMPIPADLRRAIDAARKRRP